MRCVVVLNINYYAVAVVRLLLLHGQICSSDSHLPTGRPHAQPALYRAPRLTKSLLAFLARTSRACSTLPCSGRKLLLLVLLLNQAGPELLLLLLLMARWCIPQSAIA